MKNWSVILFSLLLNAAFAQENRQMLLAPADANCTNPPTCIENPGLDDVPTPSTDGWLADKGSWYTSHGSPTPGSSSVWLWSYGGGGEGMYTCFKFESGKQYKVCLRIRTDNPPGSLGYENQDAIFNVHASNGNFSPLLNNPANQVIASWHAVDQVETDYTFTFTANDNYNKLWFFPYMLVHAPTPVDQYSMNTFKVAVEEVKAPTLTVSGNDITINNSPTNGHWVWTPANLVTNSNASGTAISVSTPCNATPITANFVSDCVICSNYNLQTTVSAPSPTTLSIGSNSVCEGNQIVLSVANVMSSVQSYQWMQLVNSQHVALADNSFFSGTNAAILTITTTLNLDGAQFYCAITTAPQNCTVNSETVAIGVFQNPPLPVVMATNPTNGSNGSILIISPISNSIVYSLNHEPVQFSSQFENLGVGTYDVTAVNGSGCESTIQVTLTMPAIGMIPRGISPNDDGDNDAFDLTGIGNISHVKIFNRYGVNVYSKAHYLNEWKGQTDKGKSLPSATYYYVILFENGESKTGWVYLQKAI